MKINKNLIPEEIKKVSDTLENAGYESYLVGGCVRDILLNKIPKDWDITTNAKPEEIIKVFGQDNTFYENNFGTVGVKTESGKSDTEIVEVTPYRIEGTYSDARRPDSVIFSDKLEDDLKRRDFTVNALAYRIKTDQLVDMFEGIKDLKSKVIRAVGDPNKRFSEDALRMLRAVRLASELDFAIDESVLEAIFKNKDLIKKISNERIRDELSRIIDSKSPATAFGIMQRTGLLEFIIPELLEGVGCFQGGAHRYDVFEHNLRTLQYAADKNYPFHVKVAALFHDIAKPRTKKPGKEKPSFHGHEVLGAYMTKQIMERLKFPKDLTKKVVTLVRWHMFFSDPDKITMSAVRRMIRNVGKNLIFDLLNLRICDRIGTGRPKEQPYRFRKYKAMVELALKDPTDLSMLKIDGNEIMKITGEKPSIKIGWTLHALFNEVLDDPSKNQKDYLEKRAKELMKLPEKKLKELSEKGKRKQKEIEEKEAEEIAKKYNVSFSK